ncbi:hypothetical protein [Roseateles sp. P5_E7]
MNPTRIVGASAAALASRRQCLTRAVGFSMAMYAGSQATASTAAPASAGSMDIQPIVDAALNAVRQATVQRGQCSRFLGDLAKQRPAGAEPRSYGSAAAACILYTVGHFPREQAEREAYVRYLRSGQSAETGLFADANHSATHATAYVLAALELFDAGALHPLKALRSLNDAGAIEGLLEGLDWQHPWPASHAGAGAFAALVIAGDASASLHERYFAWLAREQDPATGLWRKGSLQSTQNPTGAPAFDALAAAFHYLFNHTALRQPIPRPEALIDTALRVYRERLYPQLGQGAGFAELDWLYVLTRSVRQCGYRYAEVLVELQQFARRYVGQLMQRVLHQPLAFQDLHALNGVMGALAELQQTLPGLLHTERPLKLTLDRRPFI